MILVTGAAGYIGSHFVRYYLDRYCEASVVAVDNLSLGHLQSLSSSQADDSVEIGNLASSKAGEWSSECSLLGVGAGIETPRLIERDKRLHFYKTDIGNTAFILELIKRHQVTAVVHFAANAFVGESQVQPFKYFKNNVIETLGLLDAMAQGGVNRIVFSSMKSFARCRISNAR